MNAKKRYGLSVLLLMIVFLTPASLYSDSPRELSHASLSKLPRGCASCHRGHGKYNTPMLPASTEVFCFMCHGHIVNIQRAKQERYLAQDAKTTIIQREFEKPYHHPIERGGTHRYDEILPENNPALPRHVACGDCHHHHYVTKENKILGVKGVNMNGERVERISFDYELCFKCHSYSANLPADQINKAEIFNTSNPSYHPVIAPGKNNDVPSLSYPLTVSSLIKCTDCHNSDDPIGPKGPHGSKYRYLLSKNFTDTDGSEGEFQYELCYSCHSRSSILGDESFQFHRLHISTIGASCRTCHNPHGSRQYTHLIDFDNISIRLSSSGRLDFLDLGNRAGQCSLDCHGKDHNPAIYPTTPSISPQRSLDPSYQSPTPRRTPMPPLRY